jgi:Reverse transcriptase (RNA-dependent DNA polymerase).
LEERQKLLNLLTKYESLFDGTLGDWGEDEAVDLELQPDAKPHHDRPYRIPQVHRETFRKELERLCQIGVMRRRHEGSEWDTPCFLIPNKKNGTVRFLTDFRKLNSKIKRKIYPLPNISDILQTLQGLKYATTLDLNMGYYTIRLTAGASNLCTVVTEFGTYEYLQLPMGISCAPDIFQSKIARLLGDLEFVKAYLYDCLIVTKSSFDDHLEKLEAVLQWLQMCNLKINAEKSAFAVGELEYLGYVITREGIKADPKKFRPSSTWIGPRRNVMFVIS